MFSRRPQETFVNALEGRVLSAEVNGKKIFEASPGTRNLHFRLINPGPNGFVLSLKAERGQPLSLVIRERRLGLPEIPGRILPRRPPEIAVLFESTILKKTFNF